MSLVIRTKRLELRPFDHHHARAVMSGSRPEGAEWAHGFPTAATREAAVQITSEPTAAHAGPFVRFLIVRRSDGYVVGDCGFRGPPGADGVVEIAYDVATSARGRGFEAEALEALIGFAFTRDEIVSVRAAADAGDEPARRVLERAGMMVVAERAGRIHFEA